MSCGAATAPRSAHRGAQAERIAARHVAGLGMTVMDRNLRVGHLEIDILAREGHCMVVVEVRSRGGGSWLRALDTVDGGKRRRLRRAAAILWARRWRKLSWIDRVRFDVASVDLDNVDGPRVEYVRAAF
jgi:putative endonuclease